MKKNFSYSKNSLFLTELIIVLLFLSLMCSACIQIFAAAYHTQKEARCLNHIQELTTSIGEILEGSDGTPEAYLEFFPNGNVTGNSLQYYFDSGWNFSSAEDAAYFLSIQCNHTSYAKTAQIIFSDGSEAVLYETLIKFPTTMIQEDFS